MSKTRKPLFSLGNIVATPEALESLEANKQTPEELLARHVAGDWGDLSEEDKEENILSLKEELRIFSSYRLNNNEKVYVITEKDRSVTTLLLSREY